MFERAIIAFRLYDWSGLLRAVALMTITGLAAFVFGFILGSIQ